MVRTNCLIERSMSMTKSRGSSANEQRRVRYHLATCRLAIIDSRSAAAYGESTAMPCNTHGTGRVEKRPAGRFQAVQEA